MDSLLRPYLASGGELTETLLEELLVNEASPRIRKVILRKLGPDCQDLDDVCAQVLVDAAEQLRLWKGLDANCPVDDFAGYVATCSFNAASEYLRRKYPRWRRLRDRIHYVLRHDRRLAVWESAQGWLCGLADWKGQDRAAPPPIDGQYDGARGLPPGDSLHSVFETVGTPLELDALVTLAATLWGESLDRADSPRTELAVVPVFDEQIDQRRYAERLWRQILELPERQRQALLLNMRADGLDVFLLFGVVSFLTLAEATGFEAQEFAEVWKTLPLDDLTIAARMQMTRQHVINLRKSARKRLANRMEVNTAAGFASTRKG